MTTIDPSQSTLSPNFAQYVYNMLGKGEQAANLPYQPFTGRRFAGPSDLQQRVFQQYQNLAEPSQFGEATGIARLAASRAQNLGYSPSQFSYSRITPQSLQNYQMNQPRDVYAERAQAAQLGAAPLAGAAQFGAPGQVGFERVGAERVGTQGISAAQTGYRPDLQMYQMQAPSERVTSESFVQPGTAESYMSPYMQAVVGKQTREATRQADIARGGRQARFAQAGAFGGSRQAIEEAEANRNLQQQLGDIQATGSQAAFQQAQQQFNQEQQARQAAQQANIGTGMRVGEQNLAAQLGIQQLGTQTGLQTALANLSNEQQARVQNEANRLQASGMNQQQAMQAALSNQQAGMQTGQFNAQMGYNTALQNAQMRQQAELANQQMRGQYGLQQGQFQQAANLQNPQQALQAALANQQMGYNVGSQNLQALLGIQQLGAGQNLQAQQANQQAMLESQRMGEQSRQFGANMGLQGLQQQLAAGQLMGGLGQQAGQYGLERLQAMIGAGHMQQQLNQQPLDFGYQQFRESTQYPMQQASFMHSLMGGLPLTANPYSSGSSTAGGILQGGAFGAGVYKAFGG